jgi:hypothetical protein
MPVLGLSCSIKSKRPIVLGVITSGSKEGASEAFRHIAGKQEDLSKQLRELADHFDSVVKQLELDAIVIHSLDFHKFTSRDTIEKHARVEGALLAVADRYASTVTTLSGKQIGDRLGSTKAAVEQEAESLVGEELTEAGAAALAALALVT